MRTVKRLDALTAEQEARMPEWRDKWIEVGLRTGPADREAFEKHATACYKAVACFSNLRSASSGWRHRS